MQADETLTVVPSLEVAGLRLVDASARPPVSIAPHAEARADWVVIAENDAQVKMLREVRDQIPSVRRVVVIDGAGTVRLNSQVPVTTAGIHTLVLESLEARGLTEDDLMVPVAVLSAEDLGSMMASQDVVLSF